MQDLTLDIQPRAPVSTLSLEISSDTETLELDIQQGSPRSGTGDYNDLINKPSINSVELVGDKTFEDLGDSPLTNVEIQEIFNRVFG